jgi:hypothetical protein
VNRPAGGGAEPREHTRRRRQTLARARRNTARNHNARRTQSAHDGAEIQRAGLKNPEHCGALRRMTRTRPWRRGRTLALREGKPHQEIEHPNSGGAEPLRTKRKNATAARFGRRRVVRALARLTEMKTERTTAAAQRLREKTLGAATLARFRENRIRAGPHAQVNARRTEEQIQRPKSKMTPGKLNREVNNS